LHEDVATATFPDPKSSDAAAADGMVVLVQDLR
jgi:hypothetical protein